jgi:hypothetical protein
MLLYESFTVWNRFIIKLQYFNIIGRIHYIMETKKTQNRKTAKKRKHQNNANNNNISKN